MKNNRGLSLVELIVAFALLALVGVGAMGLMATGSNLFASSTRELDLQTEAQNVINHMNNFIIDTERGMTLTPGTDVDVLQVYNEDIVHVLTWKKTEKNIYYQSKTITYSGATPTEGTISTEELLASNVEDFVVDLTEVETKRTVKVYIELAYGDKVYKATQDFSLRNDIKANQPLEDYYDDEVVGQINQVTEVKMSVDRAYCAPGSSYSFSARVSGIGYPSQRVTWTVEGISPGSTTSIDVYGVLTIDPSEGSNSLTVKATSVADSSKMDAATVVVVGINNIELLPYAPEEAMIGKILRVYADVTITAAAEANVPEEMVKRVYFTLPEGQADGLEMHQTSSMTNYCELFFTTDMENDPVVKQAFIDQGYYTFTLNVASRFNEELIFPQTITVLPSDLTGIGIEGSLVASRNSTLDLDATLDQEGLTSRDIRTTWEITKDAGLGNKIEIDKNTGILTVDKNIDYNKEFKVEITATATVSNSTKKIETSFYVTIPKVTISVTEESATIEKGTSERLSFMVHGLKAEKGDVICTSKPSLKNTLMYCTENECVISVGERETRELVSVRLMLKENTDIVKAFNLYILSETELYNVQGRKNVFAPYYTPAEVGNGKNDKAENGTALKYTVVDGRTKLTIKTTEYYYYEEEVANGVTGWWIPQSNVEGEDFYVPVPGLSADLPDSISVAYKLSYYYKPKEKVYLLTYKEVDGTTEVEVEETEGTKKTFYLSGEAWKIKR